MTMRNFGRSFVAMGMTPGGELLQSRFPCSLQGLQAADTVARILSEPCSLAVVLAMPAFGDESSTRVLLAYSHGNLVSLPFFPYIGSSTRGFSLN